MKAVKDSPVSFWNALSATEPDLANSASAARTCVVACAVGTPDDVSTASAAETSSNPMPTALAIGVMFEMLADSSPNVVLPSRTAVNMRSDASVAVMISSP